MAKVLLTKKNSTWGIIINPVGDNVYRNVVNFPANNLEDWKIKRNEFINFELFDEGETFQGNFLEINDQAIDITSDSTIDLIFDISKDFYKRKIFEIMESDYCIIEFIEDGIKSYRFYSLIVNERDSTLKGTISLSLEEDIFITNKVDYFDSKCLVQRAHTDRYKVVEGEATYLFAGNFKLETDLNFEPNFRENVQGVKWKLNSGLTKNVKAEILVANFINNPNVFSLHEMSKSSTIPSKMSYTNAVTVELDTHSIFKDVDNYRGNIPDGKVVEINEALKTNFKGKFMKINVFQTFEFDSDNIWGNTWFRYGLGLFDSQGKLISEVFAESVEVPPVGARVRTIEDSFTTDPSFIKNGNYFSLFARTDGKEGSGNLITESSDFSVFTIDSGDINELENITWLVVYKKLTGDEEGTDIGEGSSLPYKIFIQPVSMFSNKEYKFTFNGSPIENFYDVQKEEAENISIQYVNTPIFGNDTRIEYTVDVDQQTISISCSDNTFLVYDDGTKSIFIKSYDGVESTSESFEIEKPKPIFTNHDESREVLNEVKMYTSQFTLFEIFSIQFGIVNYGLEYMNDVLIINNRKSLQPDRYVDFNWIETIDNNNEESFYGSTLNDTLELPLGVSAYDEFYSENRTTAKSAGLVAGIKGAAILGAGASSLALPAVKGAKAAGVLLGSAGVAGLGVFNELKGISDIKKRPTEATTVTNTFSYDILRGIEGLKYSWTSLNSDIRKMIYDFLFVSGYTINSYLSINDVKETRYHFNFIQAYDVFSNISTKLTTTKKQLISSSLENGIIFFHFRDVNTWKGIKNFDFENTEMSVLEAVTKKVKKIKTKL